MTPVIVFDVNETLLDIETLAPLFSRLFGDGAAMREWFAQLVLYSQTITLSGAYASFGEIGAGVLRMLATIKRVPVTDADVDELAHLMAVMPAHADVAGALERLRGAGCRLATLTNSAPRADGGALRRAGLDGFFERRFSVEEVRRYKPAPETYRAVADGLGVAPRGMCLVAAHVWDTLGAQLFGASSALLLRAGNAALPIACLPQPTIVAADMDSLADAIITHWS